MRLASWVGMLVAQQNSKVVRKLYYGVPRTLMGEVAESPQRSRRFSQVESETQSGIDPGHDFGSNRSAALAEVVPVQRHDLRHVRHGVPR